jgi:hypothetical protein
MEKMEFAWKDVSGEAGIEARAEQAPELRRELLQLGFRSVGYVEYWRPWMANKQLAELTGRSFDPSTAKLLAEANWVQEILADPEGRALATVRMTPAGPSVTFRSVSERGWVVDTGSGPSGGTRYRRNLSGWMARFGPQILRPLGSKPGSGFFNEEKALGVVELWDLHRRRVQTILECGGEKLRPQDGVAQFAAGAYHRHRMVVANAEATLRFARVFRSAGVVLVLLLATFFCAAVNLSGGKSWVSLPADILIITSAFIVLSGALMFASWFFHRRILPALAGPPPMPLDELLCEIQTRLGPPAKAKKAG